MKRPFEYDLKEDEKIEKTICLNDRESIRITQSSNSDERSISEIINSRSTQIPSSSDERTCLNGTQNNHDSLTGFNSYEPSSNSGKVRNGNISELERKWSKNKDDSILRVRLLKQYFDSKNYNEIIEKFSGLDNLDEECSIMLAHAKVMEGKDLESELKTLEKAEGFYLKSLKNNSDIDKRKRNLISNVYLAMIEAYNLRGDQEKANSAQERLKNIQKIQEQPPQGS